MNNGHNIMLYVIPILETLGYHESEIKPTGNMGNAINPDYVIGEDTCVEVGALSGYERIKTLFKQGYKKIIWIHADKKLPLLNCIIYENNDKFEDYDQKVVYEKKISELNNQIQIMKDRAREKDRINYNQEKIMGTFSSLIESFYRGRSNQGWDEYKVIRKNKDNEEIVVYETDNYNHASSEEKNKSLKETLEKLRNQLHKTNQQ